MIAILEKRLGIALPQGAKYVFVLGKPQVKPLVIYVFLGVVKAKKETRCSVNEKSFPKCILGSQKRHPLVSLKWIHRTPSEPPNPTTKIGSKTGGEFT